MGRIKHIFALFYTNGYTNGYTVELLWVHYFSNQPSLTLSKSNQPRSFLNVFFIVLGTLNPLLTNRPTMPSRSRNIESWETIVDGLSSNEWRHTLRKIARSPYIQVRTKDNSFQCSLKPLLKDNLNNIKTAANLCL